MLCHSRSNRIAVLAFSEKMRCLSECPNVPCVPLFKHLRLPSKGKYLKMKHFRFRDTVEADADVEAELEPEPEATRPQCRGGGKCKIRKRGRCRGIFRRAGVGSSTGHGHFVGPTVACGHAHFVRHGHVAAHLPGLHWPAHKQCAGERLLLSTS